MFSGIKQAKLFVFDLLFPKFCASCGKEGDFLCAGCAANLAILAPSCFVCGARNLSGAVCEGCLKKTAVRKFFAPFRYKNEAIRQLLSLYKYGRAKEIAPLLAEFLTRMLERYDFAPTPNMVFVPIPLHRRRERARGFNQSSLLAEFLGARFGIPVDTQMLVRVKNTKPQIDMEGDTERHANIADAFSVSNFAEVRKKIVILVDDIATSGATLNEAAAVLKKAGAKSVWAVVVARR